MYGTQKEYDHYYGNAQYAAGVQNSRLYGILPLGEMIEMDETKKLFAHPQNKKTDDYINGRFG